MYQEICCNCNTKFEVKTWGISRKSLESKIPGTDISVRKALEKLRETPITPAETRKTQKYLCMDCWNKLGNAYRSLLAMENKISCFSAKTQEGSYIASKKRLQPEQTPSKTPKARKFSRVKSPLARSSATEGSTEGPTEVSIYKYRNNLSISLASEHVYHMT